MSMSMSMSSGHNEGSFIFTRAGVAGGANSDRMRLGADCLLPFLRGTDCGVCFSDCSFPFFGRDMVFSETFWALVFFLKERTALCFVGRFAFSRHAVVCLASH